MYTEYWQTVRLVKLDQGISEQIQPKRSELSDDWNKKMTVWVKRLTQQTLS